MIYTTVFVPRLVFLTRPPSFNTFEPYLPDFKIMKTNRAINTWLNNYWVI